MIDLTKYLSETEQKYLFEGLYQNKYNLILGAGASADSLNIEKGNIPVGAKLASLINNVYELGYSPDNLPSLDILFNSAINERTKKYPRFRDFVNSTFTCSNYSTFYNKLLQIRWNYIWNLNVDNCLETAALEYKGAIDHNFVHINFTDDYQEKDQQDTFHVHLHGTVNKIADDTSNVVFTIEQYQKYISSNNTWIKRFEDVYQGAPTIALGATLHSESDLNRILLDKEKFESNYPSIIVLRKIEEPLKKFYRNKLNLVAIEGEVEDFLDVLIHEFTKYLATRTNGQKESYYDSAAVDKRFLFHWRSLEKITPTSDDIDIFSGHEPDWDDALNKFISKRDYRDTIFDSIIKSHEKKFLLISGPAFSGKTALVYSVAYQSVSRNKNVYYFDFNIGKFNRDDILDLIEAKQDLILCFDNSIDIFDKIVDLYEAIDDSQDVIFLVSCRKQRLENALNSANGIFGFQHVPITPGLSPNEQKSLYEKMSNNLALHRYQGKPFNVVSEYFAKHRYNIFSAMAGLSMDSRGFDARINKVIASIDMNKYGKLLLAVGIPNSIGLYLPKEVLVSITKLSVHEIESIVSAELSEIIEMDEETIHLHHKYMSEAVLKNFTDKQVLDEVVSMLTEISRYITPKTMSDRNIYYAIARSLMRFENIDKLTGGDKKKAIDFYDSITKYYTYNSRFWDQKSLALASGHKFQKAFGAAYNSLNIEGKRHPFALNTLATVKFKYILYMMNERGLSLDVESYIEACESLQEAFESSKRISEYPINTFISHTTEIIKSTNFDREKDTVIISLKMQYWNISLINYKKSIPGSSYDDIYNSLRKLEESLSL